MTLQQHMDLCYREQHGVEHSAGAMNRFVAAMREDPELHAAATMALAQFHPAVLQRDHISRTHKSNLEAAIHAV